MAEPADAKWTADKMEVEAVSAAAAAPSTPPEAARRRDKKSSKVKFSIVDETTEQPSLAAERPEARFLESPLLHLRVSLSLEKNSEGRG